MPLISARIIINSSVETMRITVDIDEQILREVQKLTGSKKKSPAVARALETYLRSERRRRLIEKVMSGQTDYPHTNEELEARSSYDSD